MKNNNYICEKMQNVRATVKATALSFVPSVRFSAEYATKKAMNDAKMAENVHENAQKAVFGVLRTVLAKSGFSTSGKRHSSTAPDTARRLWALRSDVLQLMGMTAETRANRAARRGYWEKVDMTAQAYAEAEQRAADYEEIAGTYRATATAAKRAGDMAQYSDMAALAREYEALAKKARGERNSASARLVTLVAETTLGDGVDLYQTAYGYLWERLAVDGLTIDSLCRGVAANGRTSVRTVYQWACILVRRAIREKSRMDGQTAAGYTYFTDGYQDAENPEDVGGDIVCRAPRLYDTAPTMDGASTAENLETLENLLSSLNLSRQQLAIVQKRLQGKGLDTIATELGVARGTVNKQMQRARARAVEFFGAEKLEKYKISL